MSLFTILLIALSLSTDTFAVAFAKNANSKNQSNHILLQSFMFGLSEMLMFIFGWLVASMYSDVITTIDHWLALFILSGVGLHMIYAAINENIENTFIAAQSANQGSSYLLNILTVIGTSIDAAAVGVTMAFIEVDIIFAAITIGLSSFFMSMLGVFLSRKTGMLLGRYAEILGGSILILIGFFIFYSHV